MTRGDLPQPSPSAVVVIGGSAGSLPPLMTLLSGLPADLPAAILVTIHLREQSRSQLPLVLDRSGPLHADWATHGEVVERGRIYVAPPGRHLLLAGGRLALSSGPTINWHRPAIDALFASAANWAGNHVVVVVLSGVLDDGAVGAAMVARCGGRVVVQAPEDADFSGMPTAALAASPGAEAVSTHALADGVRRALEHIPHTEVTPMGTEETAATATSMANGHAQDLPPALRAAISHMACPECGGGLTPVPMPEITYFRCHIGHQYAPQSLAAAQADAVEAKLWAAVAALEEQATMQEFLSDSGLPEELEKRADEMARNLNEHAATLREQTLSWANDLGDGPVDPDLDTDPEAETA